MNNVMVCLVTSSFLFLSSPAMSRSCDNDKYDKAEYLSSKAGTRVVDKFGGGQNIRVRMTSCDFNSYSDLFKVQIEVRWDGKYFSSNHYGVDGEINMKGDGSGIAFTQTYANDAVKDLDFWGTAFAGAVLLGAIAVESGSK